MQIELRCFAGLSDKAPPDKRLEVAEGTTAGHVMQHLGLPPEEVKLIFLNGVHAGPDAVLHANDRLAFVPAVGGG